MPEFSYAYSNFRLQNYSFFLKNVICLFVLYLIITGCQSSGDTHSNVRVSWEIEPDPPSTGMATINITLKDSTGQLLTGAKIQLEGNMSHPGMKPVLATAEEIAPGQYSAPIEFTMGGDWFILIKSTLDGGDVVEKQIEIHGVHSE